MIILAIYLFFNLLNTALKEIENFIIIDKFYKCLIELFFLKLIFTFPLLDT